MVQQFFLLEKIKLFLKKYQKMFSFCEWKEVIQAGKFLLRKACNYATGWMETDTTTALPSSPQTTRLETKNDEKTIKTTKYSMLILILHTRRGLQHNFRT